MDNVMVELGGYFIGIIAIGLGLWAAVSNDLAAKIVGIGMMMVPIVPMLLFALLCGDLGKAAISVAVSAAYALILYLIFRHC